MTKVKRTLQGERVFDYYSKLRSENQVYLKLINLLKHSKKY